MQEPQSPEGYPEIRPFPVLDATAQQERKDYFGGLLQEMRHRNNARRKLGEQIEQVVSVVPPSEDEIVYPDSFGGYRAGIINNN